MAQIVHAFLTTESWEDTRQVLVEQQTHLFQPEVEQWLHAQIVEAEHTGEHQTAAMLQLHLELLRESQAEGIEHAFENLAQKIAPPLR